MNHKTLFLVLVISGLILSSLIIRDGQLLLLAMPFLAYLIIGAMHAPVGMRLAATRIIDKPGVVAQEPVEVQLTVTNQGNALLNLYLEDTHFPSMTVLDGEACQRISLSAGENVQLRYVLKAERGIYTWRTIRATASDPFGLFELKEDIPAPGELVVRPASLNVDRLSLRPRSTLHSPGPVPVRLSGSSTDFLGIREYIAGDSLRRLNWRLAARHPRQLFTNEYEREEIADFGFILDARRLTNAEQVEEVLFEHSIRAIFSMSEAFLKVGNRVSLLIFGERMASRLPGYGKKQLNRMVRSLARAKLGSNLSLRYLEYLPTRLFPSRSILIMFSTVGAHDYETYARLRSFGYEILLVSPDPVEYVRQRLPQTEINSLAVRAARIERVMQLKKIMKLGVQVIDWQVDRPFETVIQKTASYFTHRRNV
ncbi:MAG TPA: DUF58 domain-containing protein [Anaerolineales bacterium]|nr:DUF58 domain-containing protein [Anaerolineales bacterium]